MTLLEEIQRRIDEKKEEKIWWFNAKEYPIFMKEEHIHETTGAIEALEDLAEWVRAQDDPS